jgi:hypothetical protein
MIAGLIADLHLQCTAMSIFNLYCVFLFSCFFIHQLFRLQVFALDLMQVHYKTFYICSFAGMVPEQLMQFHGWMKGHCSLSDPFAQNVTTICDSLCL